MRGARLVLAVSLLVGWTSAAAAESAWVLWEESMFAIPTSATPTTASLKAVAAFQSAQECLADRKRVVLRDEATAKKNSVQAWAKPEEGIIATMRTLDDHQIIMTSTFTCLPDTIDPREKKG